MSKKWPGLNHEKGPANHRFRHGLGGTRVHSSWANMVQRCTNPNSQDWKYYGARGIKICASLRWSVIAFKELLGDPPEKHTLNRIDNDRHYSCGSCRECKKRGWTMNVEWATPTKQSRNRRVKSKISFQGRTLCRTEWAESLGIKYRTIKGRIQRGIIGADVLATHHLQTLEPLK